MFYLLYTTFRAIARSFGNFCEEAGKNGRKALAGGICGVGEGEGVKRYPYFPLPENMDAIVYHPTPAILPAGELIL